MIVAELEFGQVTMEMVLSAVLIDAAHPALEDREHALNGVGVDDVVNVLAGCVLSDVKSDRQVCGINWITRNSNI
jgi:hypothetical protein